MRTLSAKYRIVLFFLTLISTCVHAEVLKCLLPSGEVIYQSKPCPATTINEQEIKIKPINPELQQEALERLKQTQQEMQAVDKAAEVQARKELRAAEKAERKRAKQWNQAIRSSLKNTAKKQRRASSGGSGGKRVFTQRIPYVNQ